eukprot:GEMP01040374.1.p1 GENE.GEMP01040374.1~~GEMP01040374.1.p1  ORF type:complete len:243 (+),score=44.67 GEMP01040374.1:164-892(+)
MKMVLVTGGAGGIGQAVGFLFYNKGYKVILSDKAQPTMLNGKPLNEYDDSRVRGIACNVADSASVDQLFREIRESEEATLTCAVNSAGIEGDMEKLGDVSEDLFDKVLAVNLKGTFLCMKAEINAGVAHIVNIASMAGLQSFPEFSPYACSKAGMISLTKCAAQEYAGQGIRINCVCPATIDTPMVQRFTDKWPEWQERTNASFPLGRIGRPEEVAEAVFFLVEGPEFIIGESLCLSGAAGI